MAPYTGRTNGVTARRARTTAVGNARKAYRDNMTAARRVGRRPPTQAIARAVRATMTKKGMDTDVSIATIPSTTSTNGHAFVLNLIQTGSGSWNRVGRKTHAKSLRIVGCLNWAFTPTFATGACNSSFVRMVVVWDKQSSGATIPTFDAIFGITAQDGTESCPDITCPPRYDNMDRFRVLRDCILPAPTEAVPAFGSGPYLARPQPFDEYIKLGNLESVYSGQTVPMTIADISTGALYVYFRSLFNAANCTVNSDAIARLRYTD